MASRPSWDGFLKFNLISVPVKAYNAAAPARGKIGFHLIHQPCGSRIRYEKVCPIHGEVPSEEVVSGYEHSKGQYVIVQRGEKSGLRLEDDKAIGIDTFVRPQAIDPLYYSGRTYYLVPDGKVALKPYAVLLDAMREGDRYAIAQVVFSGRGHVAAVRPCGNVLALTLLSYASEVKAPAEFEGMVERPDVTAEERRLAETLIEASTADSFDIARYKDEYTADLAQLIEGKAKKAKPAPAKAGEAPAVINLMDALRKSLDQAREHPQRRKAGKRAAARKSGRRKTG